MSDAKPIKVRIRGKTMWQVSMPSEIAKRAGINRKRFFFSSRDAAMRKAVEFNADMDGLTAHFSALNSQQQMAVIRCLERVNGDVHRLERAVDYFLTHDRPGEERTIQDAISLCLDAKRKTGKTHRYVQQLGYSLNSFASGRESKLCSAITLKEIEVWLHGNEWAPKTQRDKLIDLRTFLNFCIRRDWLKRDPTKGIEEIVLTPVPPRIFTVDQAQQIMDTACKHQPTLLPYFALGLFCGIRPAEIFRLHWPNIYLERGFIEVEVGKAKTRRRRLVSIADNCKEWLQLRGDLPPVDFQDRFEDVRDRVGMRETWPQNGLRHSFCSYHLALHENAAKTALEAGHSEDMLMREYKELVTKADAERFWSIRPK